MEGVEGEFGLFEIGMGVALLNTPVVLATYTVYTLWGTAIRRNLWALAGVWTLGGAAASLAWLADRNSGIKITYFAFIARSVVFFAPYFLGLVTLAWLFDRGRRALNGRQRLPARTQTAADS